MFISLKIDNVDRLPNGGPLIYSSHERSFEIGRENRDWTLPDPDKFISGRHCEVRYEKGAFWLCDVSRNGTFVNGANQRITSPYRLSDGDRLRIGRYIVSVSIKGERSALGAMENVDSSRPRQPRSDADPEDRRTPQLTDSFLARSTQQRMPAGTSQESEQAASPALPRTAPQPFSFASDPFLASSRPVEQQQRSQASSPPLQTSPATASNQAIQATEIFQAIAAGAGVPPEVFLQRDPHDVAAEIGSVLRGVVDELVLLLKARAAAKVLAKSPHRTMISAADNNPLKFVPGSEEILEIMFARRRAGYLDAKRSIEDAFRDLKTHEIATYAAMQAALSRLVDDLSPDAIEKKLPASSFASKKGRAWDAFVATWEAKEEAHENGMLDVFLAYFSEAYAKAAKPRK
jgi:type VI secretion system protein ImpI